MYVSLCPYRFLIMHGVCIKKTPATHMMNLGYLCEVNTCSAVVATSGILTWYASRQGMY